MKHTVTLGTISLTLLPVITFAQAVAQTSQGQYVTIGEFLGDIISRYAIPGAAICALIIITFAGIRYITSMGNPEGINAAKELIMGAILGLLTLFLIGYVVSYVLPNDEKTNNPLDSTTNTQEVPTSNNTTPQTPTTTTPASVTQARQNIVSLAQSYTKGGAKYNQYIGTCPVTTSCSHFVARVLNDTGVDKKFTGKVATSQYMYAQNSQCYDVRSFTNSSELVAGDILFKDKEAGTGHVGIYLGNNKIADASLNNRTPEVRSFTKATTSLNIRARLLKATCA